MQQLANMVLTTTFLAAMLRLATPLIFGTLGEIIGERAGVMNLGIEGIMTVGAMVGWYAAYCGWNLWFAVAAAALVSAAFGYIHAFFSVRLGASQQVSGIAITLLATSLSYFFVSMVLPLGVSPPSITPFHPVPIPGLSSIPVIGQTIFDQAPLTYVAILLVPVVGYLFYKTPLGLILRMVGENPQVVEGEGYNVYRLRTGAVTAGAALMGIGGAFLSISAFNTFVFGMVSGRGWVCIALVYFSSWRPGRALLGTLMFAAFDALQLRLQQEANQVIPYQFFLVLPYLLSILAMALTARGLAYPHALLAPYRREQR